MKNFTSKLFLLTIPVIMTVITISVQVALSLPGPGGNATSSDFPVIRINPNFTPDLLFTSRLNGQNELPATDTRGTGIAGILLSKTHDSLFVNIRFRELSGPATAAHIHLGGKNRSGPAIVELSHLISGNKISGVITDVTPALIDQALSGKLYINVHTEQNPNGEIRGQIEFETETPFTARLSSRDEVPAVDSEGYGQAVFTLSHDRTKLDINVIANEMSGLIKSAHLHRGQAGVNGPIVANLTDGIEGNRISITVNPTDILNDLLTGNIYINLHTIKYPGGEIRGQVIVARPLSFDALLTGDQEVPGVQTTASGLASVAFSNRMDTLWFSAIMSNLSSAFTGAHFHDGSIGSEGGVLFDLSPFTVRNSINGMITGEQLTEEVIHKFLSGNIYLNVHTSKYPDGEIRGQVFRYARDGYLFELCGEQEVPAVPSVAGGTGIVSVDRTQSNAHYMVEATGFGSTVTGAHFHHGAEGINGPVIKPIVSDFAVGEASGYWRTGEENPFSTEFSELIKRGEVYVNIHTAANSGGEIRGQVLKGSSCRLATSIAQNPITDTKLLISPNTTDQQWEVFIESKNADKGAIFLYDVSGKQIALKNIEIISGKNRITLPMSGLSTGIYFMRVSLEKHEFDVEKLIKN